MINLSHIITFLVILFGFSISYVVPHPPYWPSYMNRNFSISESAQIGTKLILETAIDDDKNSLHYEIVSTSPISSDSWSSFNTNDDDHHHFNNQQPQQQHHHRSDHPFSESTIINNLNLTSIVDYISHSHDDDPLNTYHHHHASPSSSSSSSSSSPSSSPNLTTDSLVISDTTAKSGTSSTSNLPFKLKHNQSSSFLHLEVSDSLDREKQSSYNITISATDTDGNSAYITLYIQILDVNDNPPIFDQSDYSVILNASVSKGLAVLQVRASDADEEGSNNSAISYSLMSDYFTIDPSTGIIYTAQEGAIDCPRPSNANAGYKVCVFNVMAHDHGTPAQTGRAYITVNQLDSNDHDPVIKFRTLSLSGNVSVDENAPINLVVAAISVEDPDHGLNGQTSIQITRGNELGHFRMEMTGNSMIIRVNHSLSRENVPLYNLTIVARDYGAPPRSSTVNLIIQVSDGNNYEPVFEQSLYEVNLIEGAPLGSSVVTVSAMDRDEGINANIHYSLSGRNADHFRIDPLFGLVTTAKQIDREEHPHFELTVTARDGGPNPKWAYSTLKIAILDINDEAPLIRLPSFVKPINDSGANSSLSDRDSHRRSSFIYEADESKKFNLTLTTVDNDFGANGTVDLVLHNDYDGLFQIHDINRKNSKLTGTRHYMIVSTRELDYEQCSSGYKLIFIAKDRAPPSAQLDCLVEISIRMRDQKDHQCERSEVNLKVAESEPQGSKLYKFNCPNEWREKCVFFIRKAKDRTFSIDRKSGEFYLQSSLDRETIDFYSIEITAIYGSDIHSTLVNIQVLDRNDNAPTIRPEASQIFVSEDTSIDTQIFDLATIVEDLDTNSKLEYKLINCSSCHADTFQVDPSSGKLYLKKPLDRENQTEYIISLQISDSLHFTISPILVTITDINDNPPTFNSSYYSFNIPENTNRGSVVGKIQATDPDSSSTTLTYAMLSDFTYSDIFFLNERTGEFILMRRLDYETDLSQYTFACEASDGTFRSAPINISFHLINLNDNRPIFDSVSYTIEILENATVGQQIYCLQATDADIRGPTDKSTSNSFTQPIKYYFEPSKRLNSVTRDERIRGQEFTIDGTTGCIYLSRTLNRRFATMYDLTVIADDGFFKSPASVRILVRDANDAEYLNQSGLDPIQSNVLGIVKSSDNTNKPDPISIGVILVALFFVILVLVLSSSFLIFHKHKFKHVSPCINIHQRKMGIGEMKSISHISTLTTNYSSSQSINMHPTLHPQQPSIPPPPPPLIDQQRPDVIESPNPMLIPNQMISQRNQLTSAPMSFKTPYSDLAEDYSDIMSIERHYDLENGSTVASSDIDMVYRCHRGANRREPMEQTNQNRHAPLARLSPSVSELTAPRILTLKDLSLENRNQNPALPNIAPPPLPPPSKAKLQQITIPVNIRERNYTPSNHHNFHSLNHHYPEDDDDSQSDESYSTDYDQNYHHIKRPESKQSTNQRKPP